jgi:putative ABC transport system permease protein
MFKNYLGVALRSIGRNKLFSIINIGGLTLGLAVAMLILIFVRGELDYDDWVADGEQIARLESIWPIAGREALNFSKSTPPSSVALKEYFPNEIESITRIRYLEVDLVKDDQVFTEHVNFVSRDFLKIFNLTSVSGNLQSMFSNNLSAIISEDMAHKYFGNASPLGEILNLNTDDDYVVVGVFENISYRSHLDLDFVVSLDTGPYPWMETAWSYVDSFYHYVKFAPGYGIADIEPRLRDFVANRAISDNPDPDFRPEDGLVMDLIPLQDIHLHATKSQPIKPGGSFSTVISFVVVAMMILVIGSINFMNLSTVRAIRRVREVSIRKVVGASRSQLIGQFLGEATFTALAALMFAAFLAQLALPFYNDFLGKNLALNLLNDPMQSLGFAVLAIAVGIMGGLYPAFFMSNIRPANILKSNNSSQAGSPFLRWALVVFQFAISIGLITATVIVSNQTEYARSMDLGFNDARKFSIRGVNTDQVSGSAETLRAQLLEIPGVIDATWASDSLPKRSNNNVNIAMRAGNGEQEAIVERIYVDDSFFKLFEIEPIAGRVYGPEYTSDALYVPEDENINVSRSAVVNESFLKLMGYPTAEQAVGQGFLAPGWYDAQRSLDARIVGVVPDFHMRSARDRYTPMIYFGSSAVLGVMTLSLQSDNLSGTVAEIGQIWQNNVPTVAMKGSFIDDDFAALYAGDEQNGQMFAMFAIFAVVVACSGLFGLAAYSIDQRTKEIGLRKVLGATIADILKLLSWQYVKPVVVANFIAWPVVYLLMRDWLNGFVYRIDINSLVFVGAGAVALMIAWLTVAGHAWKVARRNPIDALRHE